MIFKQFYLSCLAHASYVIGDQKTGTAAVVDPQRDTDQYLAFVAEHALQVKSLRGQPQSCRFAVPKSKKPPGCYRSRPFVGPAFPSIPSEHGRAWHAYASLPCAAIPPGYEDEPLGTGAEARQYLPGSRPH